MNLTPHDSKCTNCGHHWVDLPGAYASAYAGGCPSCGSLYYQQTPRVPPKEEKS